MPRQDGTGPEGNGPATGRGLGNCKPSKTNGSQPFSYNGPYGQGFGPGRGKGRGFGRGRGFGQGYRQQGRP